MRSAEAAVELYGNNSEEAETAYNAADNAVNAVVAASNMASSSAASSSGDGKGQGGKGSAGGMRRMYQEFVAGKKGKKGIGKQALEPYADGPNEDHGEVAEEESLENDMEVIPEEDEGNGDNGGADGPADGAIAPATSSTTDPTATTTTTTETTPTTSATTSSAGATAASTAGAGASTRASSSTGAVATDEGPYSHRILRDRNSQRIGEALWSGRYAWGMAPGWLPEDGSDTEDPSTAFNDDHMADADPVTDDWPENAEENLTEESQTTGAGDADTEEHDAEESTLPPRRFTAEP